ncbi:MAG: tRNA (adenosine(37)-N6)-threonylcarbamoyltransferase complex dimerization subunit type 1 TsaB [Spirochaetales bacterium]|nr:tRNA (adenosine(37)-N6)-threonylcarbamoyltransferase complex dimerization subunit type 1 TsaB [Spirochaetales bacterium]
MMNILAIETSTETLGICFQNKKKHIVNLSIKMGFQHSVLLMPWVGKVLEQAGADSLRLDMVICSLGPGSFTGLRIGLATAKGLAFGADCPLIGICSLDAIALGFRYCREIVIPVIDAKKNRYYSAFYREGKRITDYFDMTKETLLDNCRTYTEILLTGPGAKAVFDSLSESDRNSQFRLDPGYALINPFFLLTAGVEKYQLNKQGDPDSIGPFYLRKSEAEMKKDH